MSDPAIRARHREAVRASFADEERSRRRREVARAHAKARQIHRHADKAKAGRTRSEAAIGWIPLAWRHHYEGLRRDFGAARAKEMMLELLERDRQRAAKARRESERRYLASL